MGFHVVRRPVQERLLAIACALALSGCSAAPGGNRAVGGDPRPMWLAPDPAFAGARIAVVFAGPAPRSDRCRFVWRRNGNVIPDARTSVLDPGYYSRGDRIEAAVEVPATEPEGERSLLAGVRVMNTPPSVTRVTAFLSATPGRAEIRAVPESFDPDGDHLTLDFRWFRNGNPMVGEYGASLSTTELAVGDEVTVEVVASDGESNSPPVRSESVRFENHPPSFTSQPLAPRPTDGVFSYRAAATDVDGDALRYELVSGPDGMTVDPNGNVLWPLPAGVQRSGDHAIMIRALDSKGGEATQQITIRFSPPAAGR